ncbi:MAG: DUF4105 domain-containing protein [Myxococcota bacterium]|nr:DUF4105 domain-containing protein [Myxococcota bacterium]
MAGSRPLRLPWTAGMRSSWGWALVLLGVMSGSCAKVGVRSAEVTVPQPQPPRLVCAGLDATEAAVARALWRKALGAVPNGLLTGVSRPMEVVFADLGPLDPTTCTPLSKSARLSRTRIFPGEKERAAIIVNKRLLLGLERGGPRCARAASGAMVREWAALYDEEHLVSSSERFALLSLFRKRQGRFVSTNWLNDRLADPSWRLGLRQSFVSLVEWFSLDPSFPCRMPTMAQLLEEELGPKEGHECRPSGRVPLHTALLASNLRYVVDLDPSRVYAVHMMHAGKGNALESRFGHAMLRLVVCAPDRERVGPECLDDVFNHVVLSFRANVNDLRLSYWKGLVGGYPSQLFALPLLDVVNEYNRVELRNLSSYPIALTPEELERFVWRVIELYWAYMGEYLFFSNNCATEVRLLLASVLSNPQRLGVGPAVNTPKRVIDDMVEAGLLDRDIVVRTQRASRGQGDAALLSSLEAQGLFFESLEAELERAGTSIQRVSPKQELKDYKDVLAMGAMARREMFLRAMREKPGKDEARRLVAGFRLLEKQAERVEEAALRKDILRFVERSYDEVALAAAVDKYLGKRNDQLPFDGVFVYPARLLSRGYGIPTPSDGFFGAGEALVSEQALTELAKEVDSLAKAQFPERVKELRAIAENEHLFRTGVLTLE